jgi:hypothetical protein
MKRRGKSVQTADGLTLKVLAYEFGIDDRAEAERKIKRRLLYHSLGPYRQDRIDLLRCLKDTIQAEIHRARRSQYYAGSHGRYAALEDFDVARMVHDFADAFPQVPEAEIAAFVPFAVYLFYLR